MQETNLMVEALQKEISSLTKSVETMIALFEEHDVILVRGRNGSPSVQEEIRNLTKFMSSIKFWITSLALAFLSQFVIVGVGMAMYLIKQF